MVATNETIAVLAQRCVALNFEATNPPAACVEIMQAPLIWRHLSDFLDRFSAAYAACPVARFYRRKR